MEQNERFRQWGTNLAAARAARGFTTQQALADAVGVTQQTVSGWERGLTGLSDDLKIRVAGQLGVAPHVLFPLEPVAS